MSLNSGDLMSMLRASMNPPSRPSPGYIVGELVAPGPEGRRIDALFVPLGHARRGELHGYEFKISRADLMTELADPMKADPWLRYCTTWNLLVSDPGIIRGLQIPDAWGILAPPSGRNSRRLTVLREAPRLTPIDTRQALLTIIARLYYADGPTEERLRRQLESQASLDELLTEARRRANDAEQRLREIDPTQAAHNPLRDYVHVLLRELQRTYVAGYSKTAMKHYEPERLAKMLTDVAVLESLLADLGTRADRELLDLERVHAERGRRLQNARKELDKTLTPDRKATR